MESSARIDFEGTLNVLLRWLACISWIRANTSFQKSENMIGFVLTKVGVVEGNTEQCFKNGLHQ